MKMGGKELVMAILCLPLTVKEVLTTEKKYNVIIYRKIVYDNHAGAEALARNLGRMSIPLKFMFIFGMDDCVLVNTADDMTMAYKRLLTMYNTDTLTA
jgi:hypothetical protein